VIIIFMESAVSNQMLNASDSSWHELDVATEHDDAETLTVWAFRRWVMGLRYQAPDPVADGMAGPSSSLRRSGRARSDGGIGGDDRRVASDFPTDHYPPPAVLLQHLR
jgi:hypothetical protein